MKTETYAKLLVSIAIATFFLAKSGFPQDTVRFSEGLMVRSSFSMDRSNFTTDPIAYSFIDGSAEHPREGHVAYAIPDDIWKAMTEQASSNPSRRMLPIDRESKWERATVDKDGYFSSRGFWGFNSGLYLEYNSPKAITMLLVARGNTLSIINGIPLEGDLYDFGYSIRPVRISKGINRLYFTSGRFQKVKVMLIKPKASVMLTDIDMTLPDIITDEQVVRYGAVQVINTQPKDLKGYALRITLNGAVETTKLPMLAHENTCKFPFLIPPQGAIDANEVQSDLALLDPSGKEVDRISITFKIKTFDKTHDRTFISSIDGSVQYYSITPGGTRNPGEALFLSVHGAGVEARGQARAYKPKDWGDLIAATNRRPYGFAWEDWGRIDALEVLAEGKKLFSPDLSRVYLTGHSMGGHGTWYLGATYPSYFAAIAPSAGYADLLRYTTRPAMQNPSPAASMMLRAGNPTRTVSLSRNYLHYGVYVFHGDADETVPVEQARDMRKLLGTFHPNFVYYEYPGGKHWISDESVDWKPIFDYFKRHTIPAEKSVLKLEFYTANPGVSSTSNWLTIAQQESPLELSGANISIDTTGNQVLGVTQNIALLSLNSTSMAVRFPLKVSLDSIELTVGQPSLDGKIWLQKADGKWIVGEKPKADAKNPARNGTFKDAFRNTMVFVYGTGGTPAENDWLYARARLDASTFGYRGNGRVEIIPDRAFNPELYSHRNVIIYGNSANNSAWGKVLRGCPVEVSSGYVKVDGRRIDGDDLTCFFVYPRAGSDVASVGVVASTGLKGLKSSYSNQYFNSGTAFPDLTIVSSAVAIKGYDAVICTGFFGNDWTVKHGDFYWKE